MQDVARLIKADVGLQVACVDFGEWDMHSGMGTVGSGWLRSHLSELAKTLDAFATDLGSTHGTRHVDHVERVRASPQGERLRAGPTMATVRPSSCSVGVYAAARFTASGPVSTVDALVDGDLAGTTDYRNVLAELLEKRCGSGSLSTVFPGITSDRVGAFKARG